MDLIQDVGFEGRNRARNAGRVAARFPYRDSGRRCERT